MSGYISFVSAKCSHRKRGLQSSSVIDLDAPCGDLPTKKHSLQKKTVEKWIVENDKEPDTSIWLKFKMAAEDCDHVATLKCAIRSQFKERLQPMRNYRPTLIEGLIVDETIKFVEICTFWHSLEGLIVEALTL